jgi:transcriptional regulator GlxA family with amidase domain
MTFIMPKWTKTPSAPVRIAFVLFDSFSNLCLANCLEPLRAANTLGGRAAFAWQILTPGGAAVHSSSGLQVLPHGALSELSAADYVFVLSSYDYERHDGPETRRALVRAAARADTMVGLDAGPWLMAAAGLLDGRRATVHWDLIDDFAETFLEVRAERAHHLRDGPVMTCAGAMAALDLTLETISAHLGTAMRLDVEALFIHGEPPVGAPGEAEGARDPMVRRALALMREHLERPLPLAALARRLSCQPRTLDRRFRAGLGAPPGRVYRHLRLAAARRLIAETRLGIAEVAVRCGYDSPAALARAVRREYGRSPRALRAARSA